MIEVVRVITLNTVRNVYALIKVSASFITITFFCCTIVISSIGASHALVIVEEIILWTLVTCFVELVWSTSLALAPLSRCHKYFASITSHFCT